MFHQSVPNLFDTLDGQIYEEQEQSPFQERILISGRSPSLLLAKRDL